MGRSPSARRGDFGPLAFALQTTARTESSVCLRPDHLPRFRRRLTRPPLRLATPTAGRNAGGLLTSASRGTGLRTQPAPALTLHRRPERPDSRRHRSLLHQQVATGWRPLVEQGCDQYEAGSESGDRFILKSRGGAFSVQGTSESRPARKRNEAFAWHIVEGRLIDRVPRRLRPPSLVTYGERVDQRPDMALGKLDDRSVEPAEPVSRFSEAVFALPPADDPPSAPKPRRNLPGASKSPNEPDLVRRTALPSCHL